MDGLERMQALMARLRAQPPRTLGGKEVLRTRDYLSGEAFTAAGGKETLPMKGADMLYFDLAGGSAFIVRPSGTEPKIKCYLLVRGESRASCEGLRAALGTYARSLAD